MRTKRFRQSTDIDTWAYVDAPCSLGAARRRQSATAAVAANQRKSACANK